MTSCPQAALIFNASRGGPITREKFDRCRERGYLDDRDQPGLGRSRHAPRGAVPEVSEHFRPPSLPVQTIWCFLFSSLCNHEGCAGLLTAEPELRAGPGRHLAPFGGAVHEEVSSEGEREGEGAGGA